MSSEGKIINNCKRNAVKKSNKKVEVSGQNAEKSENGNKKKSGLKTKNLDQSIENLKSIFDTGTEVIFIEFSL